MKTPLASVRDLVIAGWTGRDAAAVERHILELDLLGVPRPASVPCFFPVPAHLLTLATELTVAGERTSGEAEFVLFSLPGGLWVGVGSDHTDREREATDVTASKRACPKPVAPEVWPFAEVAGHWDRLVLRSFATNGAGRRLHQEGPVAALLAPRDLLRRYGRELPEGTAMFGGTLPSLGPIEPSKAFEVELEDPVLGRRLRHEYHVHAP